MITTTLHPALNTPIDNNVDGIQVDHNKLLADLVESNYPLVAIARDHKLNLAQLIAWGAQPAVRALLDAADEFARRIAAHKAEQGRTAAVQTLVGHAAGLCESPRDRGLANLAARTLVRITNPVKPARRLSAKSGAADDAPIRRFPPNEPIDPFEPATPKPQALALVVTPVESDAQSTGPACAPSGRIDSVHQHANGHPRFNGHANGDAHPTARVHPVASDHPRANGYSQPTSIEAFSREAATVTSQGRQPLVNASTSSTSEPCKGESVLDPPMGSALPGV